MSDAAYGFRVVFFAWLVGSLIGALIALWLRGTL